jgi:uncharacterized cofD-like protein
VRLLPEEPKACDEAVSAVEEAEWVVLGPGSWFTSVMPHLLVPRLRQAVYETSARRMVTLNLPAQDAETHGFTAENHLEALLLHAPELTVDVVMADPTAVGDTDALREVCETLGARLVMSEVADPVHPGVHDPLRLAAAYRDVIMTG